MVDRSVLVRLRADISDFQRKFAAAGATTSVFVKNLDTADSRMGNLVQTALALAPALVPISATAVPALAGLTTQAGFAAAGVGVLVAAFNGVGDSLEALNEYQLEPTAENYAKLREEMAKLPEEGREFVRFLDGEVMPALDRLQDVAAAGALPGFAEGIDDVMERLPGVRRIVDGLADAAGQLAQEGGEGLASDELNDFFRFLKAEAEPTLLTFGRTVGNVLDGLATTLIGLNPLANDFEDALLDWSRGFADIEPEDFADFVAYVRDVGPDAVDALMSVGGALVALVEAAAPVGAVALPVIEALADVITMVANSSAGPVLIGTAAGLSAVSRSVALFNAANGSAVLGLMRGAKTDGDAGARGLSNFGKAAAGLAGVTVAFAVLDELNRRLDESLPGIDTLTGRLLDLEELGSRGFSVSLGEEFDSLAASVARVSDPDVTDGVQGLFDAIAPGDNRAKSLREASAEIKLLDEALAGLVASAGPEAAENILGALVEQGYLTEAQLETLRGELSLYDEALAGAENQERLTADGADDLGNSADDAAKKIRTFQDSLERLNALLDGRANMRDYEAAIDNFTAAMRRNGRTFDINTAKGRENQAALDGIVSSTLAVAEGMKGANRQRFLTSAIADLREMGNRFDIPKAQTRALIRELQEANRTKVDPKIDADTAGAMSSINALEARLRRIKDESVTVRVTEVRTGFGPQPVGVADGDLKDRHNPEIAPGGAWRVWAEPETQGESYIPHANDRRRPRAKQILEQTAGMFGGQVEWFADGGTAGKKGGKRKASGGEFVIDRRDALQAAIERLTAVSEDQTEAVDRATSRTDEWSQKMSDVAQATIAGFDTGLFERDSNPWAAGAGGGWFTNLTRDIAGLRDRGALQTQLADLGLDGEALAAFLREGGNADLSALINSGQVSLYEDLFNQRAALQGSVGAAGGQLAFGQEFAASMADQKEAVAAARATEMQMVKMNGELERVTAALERIERIERSAPERTGAAVGGVVAGPARNAARKHRNKGAGKPQ